MKRAGAVGLTVTPELIQKLKRGDRSLIAVIAEQHGGDLLNFLKLTRHKHGLVNDSDWLDVAQDVFAKIMRRPPSLSRVGESFLGYLKKMALHRAIEVSRQNGKRRKREAVAVKRNSKRLINPEPLASLLKNERDAGVVFEVKQKSESVQQTLRAVAEGAAIATLAGREQISPEAAQMRVTRTLRKVEPIFLQFENDQRGES